MRRLLALATILALFSPSAPAWNARGHRLVTLLALDGLPADAPAFLRDETVRQRIAFQASEVDRWRGWTVPVLGHENKPEHYLDLEDLQGFGLTLETIPRLRGEYLRALAVAKHVHPDQAPPYDASKDAERTKEWPGLLPHAIAEHYAKLQAAFWQIRTLEKINDADRAYQLTQERENAIYHMGMLSHFVADAAQPLHTTKHFNGWVGENSHGFTTSNQFHSYIDGGAIATHDLTYEGLKPETQFKATVSARDPWNDVLSYIRRSHDRLVPVYELEKSGKLDQAEGKAFISECLRDGGTMLAALYSAAWESSAPNQKQVSDFVMYDEKSPTSQPKGWRPSPASQPASP
jgi:hypothetical protein